MKNLKNNIVLCIDSGHGIQTETKAKYSPLLGNLQIPSEFCSYNRFRECRFNRSIAKELVDTLKAYGIDARMVVTEEVQDISLSTRVARVNKICDEVGAANVIMVSIHANANGYGTEWNAANGWEIYTTPGKTNSDVLATFIYNRAVKNFPGRKMRPDWIDGDPDKEAKFTVIAGTKCPAVLTENFFYTNQDDLLYLSSDEGRQAIIRTHVEGILDYINWLENKK